MQIDKINMKKPLLTTLILLIILSLGLITMIFLNNRQDRIPIIPKPKNNNSINIVFTTDKEYSSYLKVALKSLILNKDKDSIYNIYILSIDLNKKTQEELKTFKQNDVEINTVPLKVKTLDKIIDKKINFFYVSRADLFKFFIPEMFQNFDKILYLDSDILVLRDLSSLYNTDIQDKYIAAVKRYNFRGNRKKDDYNCGVMLFNIQKYRKDNIAQKLIKAKNNDKDGRSSQYSFNSVIKLKDVKLISPIYNNNAYTEDEDFIKYNFKKTYSPFLDNINNLLELDKNTIIVHYIGADKPWHKNSNSRFKEKWWEYSKLVDANMKYKKRSFIERLKNAYFLTLRSSTKKTFIQYIKKFYHIFKTS